MAKKSKLLRNICFGLTGLIIIALASATVLETIYGTPFATTYIYSSPWFITLWVVVATTSVAYIVIRKMSQRKITFMLHLSFVVILVGAFITHIWGVQGAIHLRQGEEPTRSFTLSGGGRAELPFSISLNNFELVYYQGTFAPSDFVSYVTINDGAADEQAGVVSMNSIYSYRNYRFYQSTYDSDAQGSTLSIYHDPYGIAVTYAGYALLIISMSLFFFERSSHFRQLLRHPLLRKGVASVALLLVSFSAFGNEQPKALPASTAATFGDMYVYYNDRICPMQTLARDFTIKLYGKPTYNDLTAEQVMTGWFFYYDDWKDEPIILIKSQEVRELLGIEGKYARLTDFFDNSGYKLDEARHTGTSVRNLRSVREADEKFNLISMVSTGNLLKIYPYQASDSVMHPTWYAVTDRLPASIEHEQWLFIRYSMNYVAEQVAKRDYAAVDTLLTKIKKYQAKEAAGYLPSDTRFRAEQLYNALDYTRLAAMACLAIGILSFFFYCWRMVRNAGNCCHRLNILLVALMMVTLLYLATVMTLRGIVAGHFPASNGFETMQLMAICVLLLSIVFHRKFEAMLSIGFMLCGFALLVAMFGESNPAITQLMPVLSSPLLSLHVAIIMVSYSLFGFAMFNGIAAVIVRYSSREYEESIERLQVISKLMLYPAVFLLAAGIFIGAIWANVSWGRYWGWDPKETWALITLLVYSAALHSTSLPALRRPMAFHWFTLIAFLSVLITYFGANFIMAGLHSYA